jgi:hypothetical protein
VALVLEVVQFVVPARCELGGYAWWVIEVGYVLEMLLLINVVDERKEIKLDDLHNSDDGDYIGEDIIIVIWT